jgi:hypothetical protein
MALMRIAVIVLAGSSLGACSPRITTPVLTPVLSSETEANMIANLRDGRVDLRCGAACAEMWRANLLTLNDRYVAKDWLHLGTLLIQIGYQNDLAYYYLGQSAEGLGSPKAALKFYRIAGALASQPDPQLKCNSGGPAFCNGISLPRDLYLPMQPAEKHDLPPARVSIRRPTAIATASNPPQTPTEVDVPVSVPAQDETWIEPPPATQ